MPAGATEFIDVLVIDDNDSGATWDLRFEEDFQARQSSGGDVRRMRRFGVVCTTARMARATLLRAMNEDVMPDIVLIDQVLAAATSGAREPSGLDGVMRWLRDEVARNERSLPSCVLWTAAYDPGLGCAFVASGGTYALSRETPAGEMVGMLWLVHDGALRWAHTGIEPRLELTDAQRAVLPYFEANLPTHEIVARMTKAGELDAPADKGEESVNDRRREIMKRANDLLERVGEPRRFQGRGLSVALAQFAQEHGNVWIPLNLRERPR